MLKFHWAEKESSVTLEIVSYLKTYNFTLQSLFENYTFIKQTSPKVFEGKKDDYVM